MKENKNIDALFQDKFKNLDFNPPTDAWQNIEERLLEKKEKRRVLPFWWKFSGIAASLVLGFGLLNVVLENNKTDNSIVNSDKNKNSDSNESKSSKNTNDIVTEEGIAKSSNDNTVINSKVSEKEGLNKTSLKNDETIANQTNYNKETNTNSSSKEAVSNKFNYKNQIKKDGIANRSKSNLNNKTDKNHTIKETVLPNNSLHNNVAEKSSVINKSNAFTSTSEFKNEIKEEDKVVSSVLKKEDINSINNSNNSIKNIQDDKNIVVKNNIKTSTENDIKEEIKKLDSTSIASVVPNAMEELLIEKENKKSKEPKLNRWQLTSNVAPIYFSSTTNGSPLDSELKNNTKEYNTNFSYGLGVNYAVNKKLKIRTGVNSLSIDYNTNDVVFYQNSTAKPLKHVTANTMGSVIQIENKNNAQGTSEIAPSGNLLNKFDSSINQKIGYLEIPFELSYKVLNKKIGVDVIGGFSTLVLNQNEVSLISSGTQLNIGQANNLNDIHFSTNIGLGLKYGFLKRLEARIEPVLKYQINTFNADSGSFKPYIFGLYSGISYTF
ncbi:hypothetical protein [Flavobacterium sp.]|uniref:hypothetical protein n=1 Tax=Flavobacterium sp. TaxID=239 RepID=UPI0037513C0B